VGGTLVASVQTTEVGSTGGHPNLRGNFSRGVSEQRMINYPLCSLWAKAFRELFCNTRAVLYMPRGAHVEGLPALSRGCYYCGVKDTSEEIAPVGLKSPKISSKLRVSSSPLP